MPSRWILVAVAAAMATFVIACGGDGDDETAPTATAAPASPTTAAASPTAQAGQCPVAADLCTFAATVERNLQSDLSQVVALARAQSYNCPATRPQGLGGPYPLCDQTPGQTRQGFPVAYLSSEGQIVDTQGLRDAINRWLQQGAGATGSDRFGPAATNLYTIGCAAGPLPCGNQFVLVFSQLQPNVPTRINLILYFERAQAGAQPALVYAAIGPLLQPGEEQAALAGGAYSGLTVPQAWPPIATFYRLP